MDKKIYAKPSLVSYGDVAEITKGDQNSGESWSGGWGSNGGSFGSNGNFGSNGGFGSGKRGRGRGGRGR